MSDNITEAEVLKRLASSVHNDVAAIRPPRAGLPDIGMAKRLDPLYSQLVLLTKFVLPTIALVLVLVVIAWPYLQKQTIGGITFAVGLTGEQSAPTMVNPRYTGVDKDNQPFAVTADLAHNVVMDSSSVVLEMPKADITTAGGAWMVMTASTGVYNKDAKSLDLAGTVNLFHDLGYEFNTEELHIDIADRTAESILSVQGQGPVGDITAEGFRLNNATRTIVFPGKARLVLYPGVMGDG